MGHNLPALVPQDNLATLAATERAGIGDNRRGWEYFDKRLSELRTNDVENIIERGRILIEANEELEPGSYEATIKRHFDLSYARKLRLIAAHPVLSNRSHANALPPHPETLYQLSRLPEDVLRAKLKDRSINPKTERKEVARWRAELNTKDGESNATLKLVNRAAEPSEKGHSYAEIMRRVKLHDELAIIKNTSLDTPAEQNALIELKQLDEPCAAELVSRAAQGEAVSATAEIDKRKFKPRPDAAKLMEDFSRHSRVLLRDWTRATPAERREWLKDLEEYADVDILPFSRREAAA